MLRPAFLRMVQTLHAGLKACRIYECSWSIFLPAKKGVLFVEFGRFTFFQCLLYNCRYDDRACS